MLNATPLRGLLNRLDPQSDLEHEISQKFSQLVLTNDSEILYELSALTHRLHYLFSGNDASIDNLSDEQFVQLRKVAAAYKGLMRGAPRRAPAILPTWTNHETSHWIGDIYESSHFGAAHIQNEVRAAVQGILICFLLNDARSGEDDVEEA